jgi:hypothetical protein
MTPCCARLAVVCGTTAKLQQDQVLACASEAVLWQHIATMRCTTGQASRRPCLSLQYPRTLIRSSPACQAPTYSCCWIRTYSRSRLRYMVASDQDQTTTRQLHQSLDPCPHVHPPTCAQDLAGCPTAGICQTQPPVHASSVCLHVFLARNKHTTQQNLLATPMHRHSQSLRQNLPLVLAGAG